MYIKIENENTNSDNNYEEMEFVNKIDSILNTNELMLLKFDKVNGKYDEYLESIDFKVVNITDLEIIEFYEIDVLPTILVYKNKNLIDSIEGFHTKSVLLKKILDIIGN